MGARSLQGRIARVVLVVGILAILVNSALISSLILRGELRSNGAALVQRARALAACCDGSSPPATIVLVEHAAWAANAGLTPAQHAVVLNPSGIPLASPDRPPSSAALSHLSALPRPGTWSTQNDEIVTQAPIIRHRRRLGTLILYEDVQAVKRGISGVVTVVIVAGVISLLVAALAGLYAARAVTGPIQAVIGAARAITADQMARRAPLTGPRETVELAQAFNGMVEEVARQRRMERDLLANVSHELAAPLAVILASAEALADHVLLDAEGRDRALGAIAGEARRLGGLVGDLLDLALLESGQANLVVGSVEPCELLTSLVERLLPMARRAAITLRVECPADLPSLCTDRERLEGVVLQLLLNAIAHTPAGGQVVLSARAAVDRPRDTTPDGQQGTLRAEADGIVLSIRDTGQGIAADDLPRIFERFYRGDRSRDRRGPGGVGLGLAICRQTIAVLGGTITAQSAGSGQGSTFTISLPLTAPASSPRS